MHLLISAPPDMPEIVGCVNGSTLNAEVGTPFTLVCRADHGDSPFGLTWTNTTSEILNGTRYSNSLLWCRTNIT